MKCCVSCQLKCIVLPKVIFAGWSGIIWKNVSGKPKHIYKQVKQILFQNPLPEASNYITINRGDNVLFLRIRLTPTKEEIKCKLSYKFLDNTYFVTSEQVSLSLCALILKCMKDKSHFMLLQRIMII